MKLSLIVPVLNSHEILRRQILHWQRIGFPTSDTEIIIMDDGSDPPLPESSIAKVIRTNDKRPWTWPLARNAGARVATGTNLLMYDVDHIVTKPLLRFARKFTGLGTHFRRKLAILDEDGVLRCNPTILQSYGLVRRKVRVESHTNSFIIRKDVFWELGGYVEDRFSRPQPSGEDTIFNKAWKVYLATRGIEEPNDVPTLFVFPSGRWCGDVDYNPHGLFHNLSRKSSRNYWWKIQKKGQQRVQV